ncbi:MAG: hypothetical protein J5859_02520, partial [Clostridia bacterium]|nr:hypothetical protein [Clostridia bacterium]
NLSTPLRFLKTPEEYRQFYAGYEIANHCRYHAYPFSKDRKIVFKDELFNAETADKAYAYRTEETGLYRIHTYAWTYMADDDKYMECVDSCQKELEDVFGKGKIRGYIWPCGLQNNQAVEKRLVAYGFQSIRITGCVKSSTGFGLPKDRTRWSYNADNMCLNEVAAEYEACPDDGKLKFFCFGVHSHDFENAHNWHVLEEFCRRFGNRPSEFWYASVGEIFDYEDAVKRAVVSDTSVYNPSETDVYVEISGKRVIIPKGQKYNL